MIHSVRLFLVILGFQFLFLYITHSAVLRCEQIFAKQLAPVAAHRTSDGLYQIGAQVPFYANKFIDDSKFRPVEGLRLTDNDPSLSVAEKAAGIQIAVFDNFLHQGEFYTAKIKIGPQTIKSFIVQLQPFTLGGIAESGHVQARFVMEADFPVELFDSNGVLAHTSPDLIVSYEAALPKGEIYNAPRFVLNRVPLVARVVSGEQKWQEGPERVFRQFLLNYQGEELAFLLRAYLSDSDSLAMSTFYRTHDNNCAIRIFDIMDQLIANNPERFQGLVPKPFQLVLGPDSISGPTINALVDRTHSVAGLDAVEIQDMRDEYTGVIGLGQRSGNQILEARNIQGELKLLLIVPDNSSLNEEQSQAIAEVVSDIEKALPDLTADLIAAVMTAISAETEGEPNASPLSANLGVATGALTHLIQVIDGRLKARLDHINHLLPVSEPLSFHLVLADHPDSGMTDLNDQGVRVGLPMAYVRQSLVPQDPQSVLDPLLQGIQATQGGASDDAAAFIKGAVIGIAVKQGSERADVSLSLQSIVGLNPQISPVEISNGQVELDQFSSTPRLTLRERLEQWWRGEGGSNNQYSQNPTVALLSIQDVLGEPYDLNVNIRFGKNDELSAFLSERNLVRIQLPEVPSHPLHCWSGRSAQTPQLLGQLGAQPMGNGRWQNIANRLLSGRQVSLSITDIDASLAQQQIQTIRVRVGVLGLRCIELPSVNEQFTQQAQQQLEDQLRNLPALIPIENILN
jgi:hypothetical protein